MDEKTVKKLLGLRIRQLRKNLKLTQFMLGEKINIDQRQVAYIEGGNSFPSIKTLTKLTDVFNCELKDLFDYDHLTLDTKIKDKIDHKLINFDMKRLNVVYQIINSLEKI